MLVEMLLSDGLKRSEFVYARVVHEDIDLAEDRDEAAFHERAGDLFVDVRDELGSSAPALDTPTADPMAPVNSKAATRLSIRDLSLLRMGDP
jgi:hypothetical protein